MNHKSFEDFLLFVSPRILLILFSFCGNSASLLSFKANIVSNNTDNDNFFSQNVEFNCQKRFNANYFLNLILYIFNSAFK